MENIIKVIVVDDHSLIREGLNRIISFEEDLMITGEFSNGEELLKNIDIKECNVVLLDINMPIKSGIETLKEIKAVSNEIKVVMLTVENDRKTIMQSIELGADAYILKESAGAEVVNAIRNVYEGEKYIDKSLIKVMFSDFKKDASIKNDEKDNLNFLTNRELNILFEISRGLKIRKLQKNYFYLKRLLKII